MAQAITFAPLWDQVPSGIQDKVVKWTFTGQYVNYQWQYSEAGDPYGSVNYSVLSTFLANEITTNWWISGGFSDTPSAYSASVGIRISTFGNGQQVVVTSKGLLNMYRPKVVMVNAAIHGTPANIWITPWNGLDFGSIGLGHPGGPNNMSYEVQVLSPMFSGFGKATQLCSLDATALQDIHIKKWLDNSDPYPATETLILTNTINPFNGQTNNVINLDDAPSDGWVSSFHLTGSFIDYIMFAPGSAGSIYVPLGKVTWGDFFRGIVSEHHYQPEFGDGADPARTIRLTSPGCGHPSFQIQN